MDTHSDNRARGGRVWFAEEPFEMLDDYDREAVRRYVIAILEWLDERDHLTPDGRTYLDGLRQQRGTGDGELTSDIFLHSDFVDDDAAQFLDCAYGEFERPFMLQFEDGEAPDVQEIGERLDDWWAKYAAGKLTPPSLAKKILRVLGLCIAFIAVITLSIAVIVAMIAAGVWLGENLPALAAVTGLIGVGLGVTAKARPKLPGIDLLGYCGWAHAAGVAIGLLIYSCAGAVA